MEYTPGHEFGMDYNSYPPAARERSIRLRTARYPLLAWKQKSMGGNAVEPKIISFLAIDRVLIISRPNLVGKP